MIKKSTILFSFFILTLPLMANSVTYTYTGNDFEIATGPYSTSFSVTGSFMLSSVPDDPTLTSVSPTSYSFSDGVQTFDSTSPPAEITFEIATDATGDITEWDIFLGTGPPASNSISTFWNATDVGENGGNVGEAFNSPTAGTWAMEVSGPSPVPEPGNLGLVAIGLVALGVVRQRLQRRKA